MILHRCLPRSSVSSAISDRQDSPAPQHRTRSVCSATLPKLLHASPNHRKHCFYHRTKRQKTMAINLHYRGSRLNNQSPDNAAARLQNTDIKIVLLGKTGVGKSSSGNTILGAERFACGRSLSAVTRESSVQKSVINGRSVSVIDTPGFFCSNLSKEQLSREFAWSVYNSAPGVHAFLFIVPYGRFTEQEEEILKRVQKVYGKDVLKHVIILFTYGDECVRERMQEEIDGNKLVKRVVDKCQGYHVFNNRDLTDRQQVDDLLLKIDSMIERNQGFYTHEMYKWAQIWSWENFWKMLKDFFNAVVAFLQNLCKDFDFSYWRQRMTPYMRL